MKRQAFTLIEVMVVLSILAIIAILAYNFFGSTMREASQKAAVVEVYKTLNLLVDNREMYEMKTGLDLPNYDSNGNSLSNSGILKSRVEKPSQYSNPSADYWYSQANFNNGGPTVAVDSYMYFADELTTAPESPGLCGKFNEEYSSLGNTIPVNYQYNEHAYCYRSGAGPYSYYYILYTDPN